jgi:hypothetical protein
MDQVKEKTPEQKQFANELYQQISGHEGNEQYSYLDTEDNPTDALMKKDYNRAADEMLDSKWARQVKGRSETLSSMVRNQSK